jgi:hypothetical protein
LLKNSARQEFASRQIAQSLSNLSETFHDPLSLVFVGSERGLEGIVSKRANAP